MPPKIFLAESMMTHCHCGGLALGQKASWTCSLIGDPGEQRKITVISEGIWVSAQTLLHFIRAHMYFLTTTQIVQCTPHILQQVLLVCGQRRRGGWERNPQIHLLALLFPHTFCTAPREYSGKSSTSS